MVLAMTSTNLSHATLRYSPASKSLHSLRSSPKGLVSLATSKVRQPSIDLSVARSLDAMHTLTPLVISI